MTERAQRVIAECLHLATMTEEPGHITRRFLTAPVHQVHAHLRRRMEALGMQVSIDAVGNLRGVRQPLDPDERRLVLGSHIDTVPNAGAFDGVLGVVLALEWVALANDLGFPYSIEVIAFSEEEGVRFGVPFIGSRAVTGRLDTAVLALKDTQGVSVEQAIRAFGLNPDQIAQAAMPTAGVRFVEIHIEQGPVLEAEDRSIAVVTGIVGQTRLSLEFTGKANHAGTTPMNLRHDALAAAAEWVVTVEAFASRKQDLVATVGKIAVEPGAGNVIPAKTTVSLDVRHVHDAVRTAAVEEMVVRAETIAGRRGITVQSTLLMNQPAVAMEERLTAYLCDAGEAAGYPLRMMASGAGHDAMVMATRVPAAMLFLRSPGGLSHHPDESIREQDVDAALQVGRRLLERLAIEPRP